MSLDYPLVIVASRRLGTLNHTLLTLEAARMRGLRVAAVVLNGAEAPADPVVEAANIHELARRIERIEIVDQEHCGPEDRLPDSTENVDWYRRAHAPRRWRASAMS
jgi:dethiobiotin synthetase